MAFALLSARPNSHPFQERHISLKEVVKIGRAVAKTKPSSNNAVFDCKVLSRNHAIMWYENGKVCLKMINIAYLLQLFSYKIVL